MSESENESRKTIADEIKTCPLCGGRVFWFPISNYWGCEHCKNTFNRYTVFPDEVKKTSAVGNAAAMREACQKMLDLLMLRGDGKVRCVLTWDEFNESQKMLRIALSRPPRNCDRFVDELDAQLAFLNEVWLISVDRETMLKREKFENWTCNMRSYYARWLLAPAAAEKGEGDGR